MARENVRYGAEKTVLNHLKTTFYKKSPMTLQVRMAHEINVPTVSYMVVIFQQMFK